MRQLLDPFLLTIIGAGIVASIFPATGVWADILNVATTVAIGALFFLYGARLSPSETLAGLRHWRLHVTIFAFTFVVSPLIGLGLTVVLNGRISPALVAGILYLTLVPSTIQSSIAFTSVSKGNVAGAIVSASASNIIGVFLTPALVWLLLTRTSQVSITPSAILDVALQILAPFVAGQLSRRWTAKFVNGHPRLKLIDQGSIVLIVYQAFSEGMAQHMWNQTSWPEIVVLVVVCLVVLAFMFTATWWVAKRLGFSREDVIAIQFCGTKKSLATGLPMATALFAGQPIGLLVLPLMIFHQAQLMICPVLAGHYARQTTIGLDDEPSQPA